MSQQKIPQLDGLRTIAVSMVLLTHLWTYPALTPTMNHVASFGWAGVDLFFVLSGFLITGILLRAKGDPHYFRNFYARRSLRIFPVYFALLAFVLFIMPLVSASPGLDSVRNDGWLYALYLGNVAIAMGGWQLFLLDITWSLSVEEQFYLVWPAIIRWAKHLKTVCVALIIGLPFLRFGLWHAGVDWLWLHTMMPLRADAFAMGALLAIGWNTDKELVRLVARPLLGFSLPVLLAAVTSGNFHRSSELVNTVGYTLTGMTSAGILGMALTSHRFAKVLSVRPMLHVGKVSYGVYLFHPVCMIGVSMVIPTFADGLVGSTVRCLLVTAVTVAVATVSFYLYERPFLKFKDRFENGVIPEERLPAATRFII